MVDGCVCHMSYFSVIHYFTASVYGVYIHSRSDGDDGFMNSVVCVIFSVIISGIVMFMGLFLTAMLHRCLFR